MRIAEALTLGQSRLLGAGIQEAQTECEHMIMQLFGKNRAETLCVKQNELMPEQEKQFLSWLEGREKRIPLAYLLGDTFFYSLKLKVRQGCLIPRPETERLVEEAVRLLKADSVLKPLVLDMGTGSGAIGLSLLSVFPEAKATLVDFSADALEIARANAADLGFLNRAELIHSDLFNFPPPAGGRERKFDLIVSNPPYLTPSDLNELQPEVAFEPRMALDGGKDGLDFYRKIIPEAAGFLKPRGWVSFEVGAGQASTVSAELKHCGYIDIRIFKDHQDIERVVIARRNPR